MQVRCGKGCGNQPKTSADLDVKVFSIGIVSPDPYSQGQSIPGVCVTHAYGLLLCTLPCPLSLRNRWNFIVGDINILYDLSINLFRVTEEIAQV